MRDTRKNIVEREWEVTFDGSCIRITNGLIELRDWGSYRDTYPKNERQVRRGLAKAHKAVERQRAGRDRARALKAFADREGLTDAG